MQSVDGALNGQAALVTGGGKGIGRAIALALSARGVSVLVTGRDERALAGVVGEIANAGGRARHLAGDVRDPLHLEAAVDKAFAAFDGLHIVVANAGKSGEVALDGPLAPQEEIIGTNLLGTYYTFRAATAKIKGPGRFIAISSVLAKFGVSGYAAYCASKAGILGMVRALAQELGPRKITVNAICPGWVETEMAEAGLRALAGRTARSLETVKQEAFSAYPLGRILQPEEVAELVLFLSSRAADAITGQALSICGGSTAFGG